MSKPTKADIQAAAERIRPHILHTPILTNEHINQQVGAELFFKCENLQKSGAFKARGATNTVLQLKAAGNVTHVTTHSSGNHGTAVAMAAQAQNMPATIVMPSTAPEVKKANVARYGAEIVLCEPTKEAREAAAAIVVAEKNAVLISSYNDPRVIAGQASCGLEIIEDVPDLDIVITPVGGGGMLSGTALAMHYFAPHVRVMAGEPEGADDAYRSMQAGEMLPMVNPQTIADGLLMPLGSNTYPIVRDHVEQILLVNDEEIVAAMRLIWERLKVIVEPSCAVPFAAILRNPALFEGKRVAVVLTGGNVDLDKLPF